MRAFRQFCRLMVATALIPAGLVSVLTLPLQAQTPTLEPAPEGSFTFVVIPDTQGYRGRGTKSQPKSTDEVTNHVFDAHTRWIADNIETQRIAFVSHVGDIVDKNVEDQWEVARTCMDRLHGLVPYGIAVGNHDTKARGDSSLFQKYFPASRFEGLSWYGGCFAADPERPNVSGNNANSLQLVSAEGVDLIFLHLECNAPDNVLGWADKVLEEHADRWAIIATHMDLGPLTRPTTNQGYMSDPKGRMTWNKVHGKAGNTPQEMWDKCYRKHANLLMICSGDQSRTSARYLTSVGDHGNTVHALMSDYTSSGPLRLYRFTPKENVIRVITYDTTQKQLIDASRYVPGQENHQFTIRLEQNLQAAPPQPDAARPTAAGAAAE